MIKDIIIKAAQARITYSQLQQQFSPEDITAMYKDPGLAHMLPPKPNILRSVLRPVADTYKTIGKGINFLRNMRYGAATGLDRPRELQG